MPARITENGLVVEIEPKSSIWFEMSDVVHNFTGREVELTKLHEMLTESHSDESPNRNIVCISGLGGVGKSLGSRTGE